MNPLFDRTLFVPAAAAKEVSAAVDKAIQSATEFLRDTDRGALLLVAGSLARGEAAVERRQDRWRLASDLDLVVVPCHADGDDLAHQVVDFLGKEHRGLLATCFSVKAGTTARGHFGADLWLAARGEPLTGALIGAGFARPATGPREDLELIVHQLATYLLTPSRAEGSARDSDGHRLRKALLETLRAMATPGADGITRYADILSADALSTWSGVLEAIAVSGLIEGRELNHPLALDTAHAHEALLALLGRFLIADDIPAELVRLGSHTRDVLGVFQLATVAYLGLLHAPDPGPYASALLDLWAQLDTDDVADAREHLALVAELRTDAVARHEPVESAVLYRAMQALRLDYYHLLSERNFGADVDDDGEYAMLPLARTVAVAPGGGDLRSWPAWVSRLPQAKVRMPGAVARIVGDGQGQTVLWSFPEGGSVPAHRHGPQLGIVVTGAVHLERGGERRTVRAGESFEIPDGQSHGARVDGGTTVIEVYWEKGRHEPLVDAVRAACRTVALGEAVPAGAERP
ncbi:cupin domain-containing protein [Kitasatospora sp. NPDC056076]|uniref:cupin domain-containing protein n=1 Tax=Kitasatospora sp. NPDC056076 TaxID=3345703 RepID=UPI0035DAF282